MRYILLGLFSISFVLVVKAQTYSTASVFAHNDYVHPIPFYTAYYQQVGYIEADVFLVDKKLLVAHTTREIDPAKTLEQLYLKPLQQQINKHGGQVYSRPDQSLMLMIDLKTEGVSTVKALVKLLEKYPQLLACKTLGFTISGNVPDRNLWDEIPSFIQFDGRPGIAYTKDQQQRLAMISTDFKSYSRWNGKGTLTFEDENKIVSIIREARNLNKPIRFWAAPDFTNAWIQLMKLGVDIIGTDRVVDCTSFIKRLSKDTYTHQSPHEVYAPQHGFNNDAKPKNIVLMIGDGMGLAQLFAGYTANRGKLNLFTFQHLGFSLTAASNNYITDSAAGASAMATGSKTNNRFIGVDSTGVILSSLMDGASKQGIKTAIISNGDVTDATPAAFYAHQPERDWSEAIAKDFLTSEVDILIGGGKHNFFQRKDKQNLKAELHKKGYEVSQSFDSLTYLKSNRFVLLDNAAVVSKKNVRGDFLSYSLQKCMTIFSTNHHRFFIMAEGAQIDSGGHANDLETVISEMLDFDEAVGKVMEFIDKDRETLLIVTADHETGGLSLVNGNLSTGYVHGNFSTIDHTGIMVPVFAYGPGSANFMGVYENTAIAEKIKKLLIK